MPGPAHRGRAPRVALLATIETKAEEARYLEEALFAAGCAPFAVDLSLRLSGVLLDGEGKQARMRAVAAEAAAQLTSAAPGDAPLEAAIAIGGGTGGQIALHVLRALPLDLPKILVTTLPFDPRPALADDAIVLVPTLVDIAGLNGPLRRALTRSAAMLAGMCAAPRAPDFPAVAVTALGVTQGAADALLSGLRARGHEAMVFHANGYGGAALARFAREGALRGVIDMTTHEVTRFEIAGACVRTPDRFSAAAHLPRVVLPGGLNFLGLGALEDLSAAHLARPHYRHSALFTHVRLSEAEMEQVAASLAAELNRSTAPTRVLIPMGGFSHEDRPGGAIEGPALREIAARVLEDAARAYSVARLPDHINAPETAAAALDAFRQLQPDQLRPGQLQSE